MYFLVVELYNNFNHNTCTGQWSLHCVCIKVQLSSMLFIHTHRSQFFSYNNLRVFHSEVHVSVLLLFYGVKISLVIWRLSEYMPNQSSVQNFPLMYILLQSDVIDFSLVLISVEQLEMKHLYINMGQLSRYKTC